MLMSGAAWKAGMYSEFIKRVTYVIQMYNSTLLKPNDIQYVLYSTGKLHK